MSISRIASKRKTVQWLATLVCLGIPFLRVGGESLLRLDAPTRTLLFLGARIRIEEFHLFLVVVLIAVFGFLFVTMLFGRVWCGWLCPQTTLGDLAGWLDEKARRAIRAPLLSALLRHLCYLLLAFTVAANLVWYFIPPADFFRRLAAWELGPVAGISLGITLAVVYLDLAFVRGAFCKTVCPYGRIQHLTMDGNTLTLEFDPARREECLRCGSCTRVCPMGIDIRQGLQIECINCGRCLDACRTVMARLGKSGLIRYSFGVGGTGSPFNRRAVGSAALLVALCVLLGAGIATRKEATVKIQRAANGEVRQLADGSVVNFYSAYLENRGTSPGSFTLTVPPGGDLHGELVGPVAGISIEPNANRKVDFALKVKPAPREKGELKVILTRDGKPVDATTLPVLPK